MSSLHKCLIFVWNGEVQWCREGLPWLCQWDNWPGICKKCSIWGNPYSQAFKYILTRTSCTQASDKCFSAGRSSSWGCKGMCVLCTSANWSCSSTQLPEARYIFAIVPPLKLLKDLLYSPGSSAMVGCSFSESWKLLDDQCILKSSKSPSCEHVVGLVGIFLLSLGEATNRNDQPLFICTQNNMLRPCSVW